MSKLRFIGKNIVRINFTDEKTLDILIGEGFNVIIGDSWENRLYLQIPKNQTKTMKELGLD